jgi:hypothetical protein
MLVRILGHLQQWAGVLALFLVLTGGVAYAANTVFSTDIVNDQVYSADVRNDTLSGGGLAAADLQASAVGTSEVLNDTATGGGLAAADLRSGSVGPAEAAGLTGADIANAAGGSDNVNADKLDGLDSSSLVQGRGTLLSNRLVFMPSGAGEQRTLLVIPGLGHLVAECSSNTAFIVWHNSTSSNIDLWVNNSNLARVAPPGYVSPAVAVNYNAHPTVHNPDGFLGLGRGDDPGPRSVATLQAFAFLETDLFPCGFQAQGTLWTSE